MPYLLFGFVTDWVHSLMARTTRAHHLTAHLGKEFDHRGRCVDILVQVLIDNAGVLLELEADAEPYLLHTDKLLKLRLFI